MSRDVTGWHSTRAAQPPRNSWRSPSPDRVARRRVKQPDNACDISRNRFPVPRPGVRARPGPPGEGGRGRRLFDGCRPTVDFNSLLTGGCNSLYLSAGTSDDCNTKLSCAYGAVAGAAADEAAEAEGAATGPTAADPDVAGAGTAAPFAGAGAEADAVVLAAGGEIAAMLIAGACKVCGCPNSVVGERVGKGVTRAKSSVLCIWAYII